MIGTRFCYQVVGISCILLSLGAIPAQVLPENGGKPATAGIRFASKKTASPVVELLPHGCQLDTHMQQKIYRGIQFQYDFFAQFFGYKFSRDLVVRIRIFKNADAYRAFIDTHYPHIPKTWIGVYLSGVNEILVSLEEDQDAFYKNIFHETSHLLLTDKVKNCPNWLNEGLAEYFEFMNLDGEEAVIQPQAAKDSRIKQWHQAGRLPDLLTSISMTNKEWNFNDNISETDEPRTLGWSVAFFLMSSTTGRDCLKSLLEYLSRHPGDLQASVRALNEYYPGGTRRLVDDWRQWIPQTHFRHAYLLSTPAEYTQTALAGE